MIHPTSVTNIVDRLEGQGLVRRVDHPTDRRTTLCEITDGRPGADGAGQCSAVIVGYPIDIGDRRGWAAPPSGGRS